MNEPARGVSRRSLLGGVGAAAAWGAVGCATRSLGQDEHGGEAIAGPAGEPDDRPNFVV